MNELKSIVLYIILALAMISPCAVGAADKDDSVVSTKKERNHISKGNSYYNDGNYRDAMKQYKLALEENPSSVVGKYNLGLSEIRIGSNPNDTSQAAKKVLEAGIKDMRQVADLGQKRPDLASRANYNLGNVAFNSEDYKGALNYYKEALRLNPNDNDARRNLRITQLKIQNQEDNQEDNQQEDNQEQEQEQNQDQNQDQEQNQEQNQEQEQEQNQDQNQEDQQQEQQEAPGINQQTAEQILNSIENKENQTRARVAGENAEKSRQRNKNPLNW